ncbi:hypothetical protein SUGI_1067970 [Cryptomeria japonica]|nr:hypothetical protein SUGI_1067970 [Cryptomeria japonica]
MIHFRWSTIASRLPERTDNEIKNVRNTHLKKRLLRMGIDPVTHAVTNQSDSPTRGENLISVDYSDYSKEASPSIKEENFAVSQAKASVDYSEYSTAASPLTEEDNLALCQTEKEASSGTMAGDNLISLDYSECNEAGPSMKNDMLIHNSALTQPKVFVDHTITNLSYSDDLSSEIFSSTDNETANSDSTLDCIQFDCNDSFDVELWYQQYPITTEDHSKCQDLVLDERFIMGDQSLLSQSSEDLYLMSANAENDMLNSI